MMIPKFRLVLEEAIEQGVAYGYRRAYKHNENPNESSIIQSIYTEVMNSIDEFFDFIDTNSGETKSTISDFSQQEFMFDNDMKNQIKSLAKRLEKVEELENDRTFYQCLKIIEDATPEQLKPFADQYKLLIKEKIN
jgi:hypothetical protein